MKSRLVNGFALGLLGTVSALVFCAPAAYAQQDDEEIIVTANRREQALQDVPLSVAAVSAEQLEQRNINNLVDLRPGAIAGVVLSPFAGTPTVIAANIRGVGLSDPSQGTQELAVPIYIDGVFLGRAQGLGLDLIEPQRVEFLRGPQGQLFGRNAEGGAIQFVSRDPAGVFGFNGSASFGSFDERRYRLRVDLPEIAGVSLQLAYLHREREALTQNGATQVFASQADWGTLDIDGYRIAALWEPTNNFSARYTYDYMDGIDNQPMPVWVPVANGIPANSPQPAYNGTYPRQSYTALYNEDFNLETLGHALTLSLDLSDNITLKSISSYREAGRNGSSTLGGGLVAGGSSGGFAHSNADEIVVQDQWSQEVQFLGSWDNFDLTAGVVYYEENVQDERRSLLTGPALTAGSVGGSSGTITSCIGTNPCMVSHSEQGAQTQSLGIYAQGTYTIDRLELTLGVRYSDDQKDAQRTYIQPPAAVPVGGWTEATPSGPLPTPSQFTAQRWDPAATILYNWTDDFNTYFRYATAYRAGGANVRSSVFSSYGEEEIETFEVGFKSQFWDRRVTLNGAVFQNTISGAQSNIQENPSVNPSLTNTINNSEDIEIRGLELESTVRLLDGLTVNLSYAYLDTEADYYVQDNPFVAGIQLLRFYTINSPEHSGSIGVTYVQPVGGATEAVFHVDYAFATEYWTTPGGISNTQPAAYQRPQTETSALNGRITLRNLPLFSGTQGEISVWGRNLLDTDNYVYGFDGGASGGGFMQFLEVPLSAGVEFRLSYN